MEAKDIIGYEGLYKIYPDGRIWSCKSKSFRKIQYNQYGYATLQLYKNNKDKHFLVSRLLVKHFKPDEWDENLYVDHINRVRSDNRLDNLRMVTHVENCHNKSEEVRPDSQVGHKYIKSRITRGKQRWIFRKVINKKYHTKQFSDLDEAIKYRDDFLSNINGKL